MFRLEGLDGFVGDDQVFLAQIARFINANFGNYLARCAAAAAAAASGAALALASAFLLCSHTPEASLVITLRGATAALPPSTEGGAFEFCNDNGVLFESLFFPVQAAAAAALTGKVKTQTKPRCRYKIRATLDPIEPLFTG